jgi:hypothetical protein
MNSIKFNKQITSALTIVMFMTLAYLPLPARERRGARVGIWRGNGVVIEGELIQVNGRTLRLATQLDPVVTIDIADVKKIRITKKANLLKASLVPVILGALVTALGLFESSLTEGWSGVERPDFVIQASCTSISAGGVISALKGLERTYNLEGKSQLEIDQLLRKLDNLALFTGDLPAAAGAGSPAVIFAAPQRRRLHLSAAMGFDIMPLDKGYANALAGAESTNSKIFAAKDYCFIDSRPFLHLASLRAEYSLNPNLRVGLQLTLPRDRLEQGNIFYNLEDKYGPHVATYCNSEERHESRLFFLTASYAPEADAVYKRSGIRLGAGIGLGHITTISRISNGSNSWEEYERVKFRRLVPALTTSLGYDYYIHPNLSIGVNLDYRLARVQVPDHEFHCVFTDYHEDPPAILQAAVTIPAHLVNVGGLAYGISLVCHF